MLAGWQARLYSGLSGQPVEAESSSLFTNQSRRFFDANWLQLDLLPWIMAAETTVVIFAADN